MNIKLYSEEDYSEVAEWYRKRKMPPLLKDVINCPSIFVTDDEGNKILLLIVFLAENAPVASIGFAISNPDFSSKEIYKAMERGINAVKYIAERQGVKLLFCNLAKLSHSKLLDKMGFYKGAKSTYERFFVWA